MESLASKLEESRLAVASTVRGESKRWQQFLAHKVASIRQEIRANLSAQALERRFLLGVDEQLLALDLRLKARIESLGKKRSPKKARGRKAHARPARASATALAA